MIMWYGLVTVASGVKAMAAEIEVKVSGWIRDEAWLLMVFDKSPCGPSGEPFLG